MLFIKNTSKKPKLYFMSSTTVWGTHYSPCLFSCLCGSIRGVTLHKWGPNEAETLRNDKTESIGDFCMPLPHHQWVLLLFTRFGPTNARLMWKLFVHYRLLLEINVISLRSKWKGYPGQCQRADLHRQHVSAALHHSLSALQNSANFLTWYVATALTDSDY